MNQLNFRVRGGALSSLLLGVCLWAPALAQSVTSLGRINPPASGINLIRVRPGDWVEINGSGLNAVRQIRFGFATATFAGNASRLVAVVPPGATIGPLSLADSFGDFYSTSFNFQISPRVSAYTRSLPAPTSSQDAIRGVPGNRVRITGENFVDPSDPTFTSVVLFPNATGGWVQVVPDLVSATTVEAVVPSAAVSGNLLVVNPAGDAQTAGAFYLQPIISSMSPARAKVGDVVTLTGTSLLGASEVLFGSVPAVPTSVTPTNLTVVVPSLSTSQRLTVTTPGGSFLMPTELLLLPRITSFSPEGGGQGAVVTLNGDGLSGTTGVWFGDAAALRVTNISSTQVTAVVPAGIGIAPITLTTANGTNTTTAAFFGPPSVTSYTPAQGKPGASIVINGSNFSNVSRVRFSGGMEAAFTVQSATRLSTTVPLGAVTGPVTVTTPGGDSESGASFTVQSTAPLVIGFLPGSGAPGTSVRIIGDNLAGTTGVRFNGVTAPNFTVVGETNILTVVPAGATSGRVLVLTTSGSVQSPVDFLVGVDADLELTAQILATAPAVGEEFEATYEVRNLGPIPSANASLTVTATGTTVMEATTSQGVTDVFGSTATATLGTLGVNSTALVSIRFRADTAAAIQVTGLAESETVDPDTLNNQRTIVVRPVRPALSIQAVAPSSVEVRWPALEGGWVLEQAEDPMGTWGAVTGTVEEIPTGRRMVLPTLGTTRHFRLRRP